MNIVRMLDEEGAGAGGAFESSDEVLYLVSWSEVGNYL